VRSNNAIKFAPAFGLHRTPLSGRRLWLALWRFTYISSTFSGLCQDSWRAMNMEVARCASTSILENDHEKNNAKFGSCCVRVDGVRSWWRLPERQPTWAMLSRRLTALSLPLKLCFPAEFCWLSHNHTVNRTPKAYRFWFPPLALRRRLPQR